MRTVEKWARRLLVGEGVGAPTTREFPGYMSFDEPRRPKWWTEIDPQDEWGTILGAHEGSRDASVGMSGYRSWTRCFA